MFNGFFEIYEGYYIVPEPILSDSFTNVIEFFVQDFSESMPYVEHTRISFSRLIDKRKLPREPKEILNKRSWTDSY